jgi:photosystem II stability/assembly factor-like uncharacterized protein
MGWIIAYGNNNMKMKPGMILSTVFFIGAAGFRGCALPVRWESGFLSPGRWEEVRRIEYGKIPSEKLFGDLGPAYRVYLVTVAAFHDGEFGLTAGPDDDVRYTADGGETWTRAVGELHCRHGLEIVNEQVAWHCGNGGTRRTVDGGRTWKTVAPSACPNLSFLNAQTGWSASPYELKTTGDGGATWQTLATPAGGGNITAIALPTQDDGYVLDDAGNLYSTADGGRSWETRSLGLKSDERLAPSGNGPRASMRFLDNRNGIIVFDRLDRSVWFAVTGDGGRTWQRAEISVLRDQSYYFQIFLSRDGRWLTVTDDFNNGRNASVVFRYVPD